MRRFILSGGYNIGVRYEIVNNTLITTPDFSFENFGRAHDYISEAGIMRSSLQTVYNLSSSSLVLDELSATTDENARAVAFFLLRSNFLNSGPTPTPLRIGILSNLFHLPKALHSFKTQLNIFFGGKVQIFLYPLPAEDYCILDEARPPSDYQNYIVDIGNAYQWAMDQGIIPKGMIDVDQLLKIMRARKGGDLSQTVTGLFNWNSL